ncbi:MAG: prolyl oligopeptidase family serine peptidase [Pseudomonadota bacterium]
MTNRQLRRLARHVASAMLLFGSGVAHATPAPETHWTLEDVLAIPHVMETALAADGRTLAYILRVANQAEDRTEFELHVTDFRPGGDKVVIRSPWIDRLQSIPGHQAWSVLADLGVGVQLYRVDETAKITSLVINPVTVLVGSVDGGEPSYGNVGPAHFGVAYYDWSPDGRRLFYSILQASSGKEAVRHDEAVTRLTLYGRRGPAVTARFFLREEGGSSHWIADAPATDRVARFLGGMPSWHSDAVDFSVQADDLNTPHIVRNRWRFEDKVTHALDDKPSLLADQIMGPHGGTLSVEREGAVRRLRERDTDGGVWDYGVLDATMSDWRSPGHWLAPDGSFALVAVRYPLEGRYGLLKIHHSGRVRRIEVPESLTHCSFTRSLAEGVCIREGVARPPEFVRVTTGNGEVAALQPVSARHQRITPLRTEAYDLVNAFGFRARSQVVFPRDYVEGRRYPAILVTHGTDADERYGAADLQWHYPVQLFAERGYVVLLANEPYPAQSPVLEKAGADRNICGGETSPAQLRRLGWFNQIESFRSLINVLATKGIVDAKHVGIAGYSYGSQIANVAVTQTGLFKAASSGDGGFLEPTIYRTHQCAYKAIYGGPPGDPAAQADYEAFAPSYRARFAQAPVLQQVAAPHESAIDFHQALRAAKIPAELSLYPGETEASDETHFFHIPSNQMKAMSENLDWFDFWLKDVTPSSGPSADRTTLWQAMRDEASSRPIGAPSSPPR